MKTNSCKIGKRVIRAFGRDIIMVYIKGQKQAFYRSTGRNSGHAGTWFPFDGISPDDCGTIWFNKAHYCVTNKFCYLEDRTISELDRYGSVEMKEISLLLATLDIPKGKNVKHVEDVNRFIDTPRSRAFNTIYQKLRLYDDYNSRICKQEIKIGDVIP